MGNNTSDNLLTTEQVAGRLGTSVMYFYKLSRHGGGPPVAAKIGNRKLYRPEDVDAWNAGRLDSGEAAQASGWKPGPELQAILSKKTKEELFDIVDAALAEVTQTAPSEPAFPPLAQETPPRGRARSEARRIIGRIAGDKLTKDEVGDIIDVCFVAARSAAAQAAQTAPGEAGEAPSLSTLTERTTAAVGALVAAHKARPAELYTRVSELQAASQAVKAEHGAVSLAFMEAEQAVAKATLEACAAIKEAQRIETAAQEFLRALQPVEPTAAPARKSTRTRLAEARIELSAPK